MSVMARVLNQKVAHFEVRNLGVDLSDELSIVLDHLTLEPRSLVLLDSRSGTGKSTLIALLLRAIAPTALADQTYVFEGRDMLGEGGAEGQAEIAFVPQVHQLIKFLSLRENIVLGLGAQHALDEAWLARLAQTLEIQDLLDRLPSEVSVGQRQRAAIARAFIKKPKLVLMDEPFSALDPQTSRRVIDAILSLRTMTQASFVIASHDLGKMDVPATKQIYHRAFDIEGRLYSTFSQHDLSHVAL